MSPLAVPPKSEGLIQPSITSHPPKFTSLALEPSSKPSTITNEARPFNTTQETTKILDSLNTLPFEEQITDKVIRHEMKL